jgi:thimet oligopeptidase
MSGTAAESASPAELAFTPDYRRYVLRSAFASLESAGREKVALGAKLQTEFVLDQSSWASADELIASFATRNGVDWLTAATDLEELSNRLQAVGAYPNSVTGFRWDASEAELTSLAGEVVARSQRVLDGIAALKPGEHTFTNTLQALNDNDRIVDLWSTCVSFPGHVSASKAIRDVSTALSKSLSEFEVSQSMRVDLYDSFKAFSETAEAKALKGEAARLLEFTLRDLRRNGLHLPLEQRQRVEAIKKRMSNLGIEFGKNLGEENAKFEFTKEQLEGVPEDQMQRWKKAGAEDTYVVSLKYPDYFPCMELCSVEATRAQLEKAYNSRCMAENVPILEELVRLRAEQASILGYPTHAAYVLETRMAKSPDVVGPFLTNLSKRLTPLMEEELAYWRELKTDEKKKRGETIPEGGVAIEAYDVRYYSRLSELLKYKVDDQAIKRYFPIEVVTAGLLQIFQTAFGLVFEELTGGDRPAHSVWHEEVQLFRVKDADTQKLRGYFYLDLYPREGKYGHAAVWGLKAGCQNLTAEGGRQLPVAGMVCNFTKATADQPSLLQHSEVNTYFHEVSCRMSTLTPRKQSSPPSVAVAHSVACFVPFSGSLLAPLPSLRCSSVM